MTEKTDLSALSSEELKMLASAGLKLGGNEKSLPSSSDVIDSEFITVEDEPDGSNGDTHKEEEY